MRQDIVAFAICLSTLTGISALALPKYDVPGERPPGIMKHYFGQVDLLNCEYDPPVAFDKPHLLERLYGRGFDPYDHSGGGNIVVLGAHNSGTSMVTRLVMLMGAFAGNFETISIHRHNKLKYYEQFAVSLFHDAFLGKFVDTRFRPYHGQGLNYTTMTDEDKDKLDCFARKQMQDMMRHEPWVMKDPRMALTMPYWRPHIPNLVCIIVHKDPVKNSISLASNGKKSSRAGDSDMMTAQRWLNLWGDTVKQGLEGCRGRPTLVFGSRIVIDDVDAALRKLKEGLERSGVRGLKLPAADEVDKEIKAYIRTGPREYGMNKQVAAKLGLTDGPEVDETPPEMSIKQAALDEALRQFMLRTDEDPNMPLDSVASSVLDLASQLQAEAARRTGQYDTADLSQPQNQGDAGGLPTYPQPGEAGVLPTYPQPEHNHQSFEVQQRDDSHDPLHAAIDHQGLDGVQHEQVMGGGEIDRQAVLQDNRQVEWQPHPQ